jgi:uncharacterized protein (DUF952 family)/ABC-type cobalamin/Fe3+-siderophores transport system ATPase subunit
MLIYHIVLPKVWEEFKDKEVYEAESLGIEGFVHCSDADQVDGVLQRYYKDATDLVILSIDVDRLSTKPVYEKSASDDLYPHIYARINAEAITDAVAIKPRSRRFELTSTYKSLSPFEIELPRFLVVTGPNGSGKTHLLEAISNDGISNVTKNGQKLRSIRLIPSFSLEPSETSREPFPTQAETNPAEAMYQRYVGAQAPLRGIQPLRRPSLESRLGSRHAKQVRAVATHAGKGINELELEDFKKHLSFHDSYVSDDFLTQKFSVVFKRYWENARKNQFNRLRKEANEADIPFLTNEEFLLKYRDPRKEVNDLIRAANLDFEFNEPREENDEVPFELKLVSKSSKAEIGLKDLSSGEKTIMSLVFALYNSKLELSFPDVLLLDEPDASLHPAMTKQFLDVLVNDFVKAKGIQVIMTTHSPSTVALAPEEAVFVMNKETPRLEKTTRDKALRVLTAGVPSLSINYENRRQVFVESENDVKFYDKFYEKLKTKLTPEISLSFISSGESKTGKNGQKESNCDQVGNITNILRQNGNKSVFGIIDWDCKNNESDFVRVLGKDKRYSIENYLFDPIFVAALLLQECIVSREELGLNDNETYVDFRQLPVEQLQIISNFVTEKVRPLIENADEALINVGYVSGIELQIPQWYLTIRGHDLFDPLVKTFPGLNEFKGEGGLKNELLTKFIDNLPEFIPIEILELLRSIQDA